MKKLLALLLTVVLLSALFVGCSKDSDEKVDTTVSTTKDSNEGTTTTESEPAANVELRIVTMFGGTDPSTEVFAQQLKDFMVAYPNVTIKNESMTSVGDEYRTAVKTDFSTGNEADVTFFYTGADAKGIIDSKAVVSIEELQAAFPEVGKDISPAILDAVKEFDGKAYALPMTGFYEGLFVNKAMFDQYGLELPTNWDNLLKAIEVLNANGITPFAGPVAQSHYLVEHFIYSQAGPDEYQDKLEAGVPESWATGLNNIKDLYDLKAFSEDSLTMDIEMAQNLFKQEKAGMILEGSWFIGGCEDALRAKMTVMPMPTAPTGKKDPSAIVAGFTSGYYVSRSSFEDAAKQQAVIDLVSYLTTKEAIGQIAKANGGTPSADVQVEGLADIYLQGNAMAAAATDLKLPIDSRLVPEAFNYIIKEGTPYIVYGERTAQEVLEEVKKIQDAQ